MLTCCFYYPHAFISYLIFQRITLIFIRLKCPHKIVSFEIKFAAVYSEETSFYLLESTTS